MLKFKMLALVHRHMITVCWRRNEYLLLWLTYIKPTCPHLQVSCVWVWNRRTSPFPESHDRAPSMGTRLLFVALLCMRILDQSGGRDEGSRQHAHSGEHSSQWTDQVGWIYVCVCVCAWLICNRYSYWYLRIKIFDDKIWQALVLTFFPKYFQDGFLFFSVCLGCRPGSGTRVQSRCFGFTFGELIDPFYTL